MEAGKKVLTGVLNRTSCLHLC